MEHATLNRWSSLPLAHGRSLTNRVVVPPMASQTADSAGFVTAATLAHYHQLAAAHPGLLIVEYTFVHATGRSEDHQLGASSDAHTAGLAQLAQAIHAAGPLAGLQLTHSGGKSERSLTGGALQAPSAVPVPVKDRELETPERMTLADIELWKSSFIAASDRAVAAGFDLVELHAAHGYGLNQWLSPLTNRREDQYGGPLAGRMRLLLEIVTAVRARHPRLLLSVRMPGQDFLDHGLTPEEAQQVAQALATAGVDVLHVSSGIGGWRRPTPRLGEGYLVAEAAQIQSVVKIPVIGVGGIESGRYIDESLRLHKFSLAAVGRAILKDPTAWHRANLCRCG